jgi:hypothetical protein
MAQEQTLVYLEQGGSVLNIASGGELQLAGTAITASAAEINAACDGAAGRVVGDLYTATAADASAGTTDIVTGLTTVASYVVMILRSDAIATSDAAVSEATGTLTIADGSTYTLTADDVIHWIAFGT